MEHSHILLSCFLVFTLMFIASANHGGYKILNYGEDYPAYPWQRVNNLERVQRAYNSYEAREGEIPKGSKGDFNEHIPTDILPVNLDGTYSNPKPKKSNFEEQMTELGSYGTGSGTKVIYGRIPVRVILVSSYPRPKH